MRGCLANQADLDAEWNLFIGKDKKTHSDLNRVLELSTRSFFILIFSL